MKATRYFFIFTGFLVLTIITNIFLGSLHYKDADHRRLQKEIDKKFRLADKSIEKLKTSNWDLNTPAGGNKGIILIAYRNDSLIYWSDNTITFERFRKNQPDEKRFDFISNGWYIIKPYVKDSLRAYALILVKTEYPYENDFLVSRFHPDLRLPKSTELFTEAQPGSFSIHDWEGIYLFSIQFSNSERKFAQLDKYLIPAFWLITFIALLWFIHGVFQKIARPGLKNAMLFALVPLFFILRWLQYKYHIPQSIYSLELFGPVPFAKSAWLPSLGDVFLNTTLLLFLVLEFNLEFNYHSIGKGDKKRGSFLLLVFLIIFLTVFYAYAHFILSNLILHSTINFDFYKVSGLNVYTVIGLTIAAMHFAALLLLANKLLSLCSSTFKLNRLILILVLLSTLIFVALYLLDYGFDAGSHIAFVMMFIIIALLQQRNIPMGNYTAMAFMVIFFSVYSVYVFTHFSKLKTRENMRVMAENLAAQHDPVAEYLLEDISKRLGKDGILAKDLFNMHNVPDEQIFNHLRSNYFNGFWGKYKILFQSCTPTTEFLNEPWGNCYAFYTGMLDEGSMKLSNTNFYFRDVQNGKINYLGWLTFKKPATDREVTLFLELETRLISEELGFPELLLDKKYQKNRLLEEYSYAKYNNNQLLAQSGSFQYSLNLNTYKNKPARFEGYDHLIYYMNKSNVVMVSKPSTRFFDNLISFSYIFLFYYMIVLIFISLRNISNWGGDIEFNFKNKIQLSIIAILFLSLFLVGGGTIYFTIQQYQKKQHDILSEKIQSVYIELDHELAYLPRLKPDLMGPDFDNLNQLLVKYSDVFYSDINLYDPQGNLLATSRDEIFEQGMQGEKMNPMAYDKMVKEKQAEYIHQENIGNLRYLSAYVPFVSAPGELMAFLNLPYFTKQNILRNDVTTLVVAVVNIYVLLILITIAMAVLISDQITRPLRMIQQKFSEIKLGKKNELIVYKGHDEIAGLVDEYNRMMKEMVKSMELLARSERETAWREMAKQVAHEIKNPLTPMKLSVQHLQRSWKDNRENFDELLDKMSRTLVEQIDNLSFIASEFSNFAKMPKAINEEVNIVDSIRSALTLFANTENIDFVFDHEGEELRILADREQLSRVFINLIKNAIQSIPENRHGKIVISAVLTGSRLRVNVADNGKGIPADLQSKLFTPSFTTKSSGMGLGLSIVKNIIESFGGTIGFITKVNHGTTFLIEFPVIENPN